MTPAEMNELVMFFNSTGFNSVNQEDLAIYKIGAGAEAVQLCYRIQEHKIQATEPIPESIWPVIDVLDEIFEYGNIRWGQLIF